MKGKMSVLLVLLLAIMLGLSLVPSSKADGVIGVTNVPPAFDTITIDATDEQQFTIDLELFDMNGADGIYQVYVEILGAGDLLANFSFNQYELPDRNSTKYTEKSDQFKNNFGNFLEVEECEVTQVPVSWTQDLQNLRVIFRFKPLEADHVRVKCIDTGNLTSVYLGPFPGSPGFLIESAVLPITVSGFGALAGAGAILLSRFKGDSLAKLAENKLTGR